MFNTLELRAAGQYVIDELVQLHRFALQGHVRARKTLALQQVGDQVAHLGQVAQQCLSRAMGVTLLWQQFGVQPGPRQG